MISLNENHKASTDLMKEERRGGREREGERDGEREREREREREAEPKTLSIYNSRY